MVDTIQCWEYRVEEYGGFFKREPNAEVMQEVLDEWGAEGWELVNVVYAENTTRWRIFAKRPLTSAVRRSRGLPAG